MSPGNEEIELALDEIRAVTGFAARCANVVLPHYERADPGDPRPRRAIEAGTEFAGGGPRRHALRKLAMDAHRAGTAADSPAAGYAAMAASQVAASAYLHPLAQASQVKHLLGSAAYAAAAVEAADPVHSQDFLTWIVQNAPDKVCSVLRRFPAAPGGGKRPGELLRRLDADLRR